MPRYARRSFAFCIALAACISMEAHGQTINLNAQDLIPHASLFLSPANQTILEGSVFDVSIYLNTENSSVNTLDLSLQFPENKLQIVSPSGGRSLVQLWLQPPSYSNTNGTMHLTGVVPNGIVTQSGLVTTITFKAIASGEASVTLDPNSSLLANDGQGTKMRINVGRATYTISPKPPEGAEIFSPTHPFQSQWYNNNDPTVSWNRDATIDGYSYVLDNQPTTIPPDTLLTTSTSKSYENLGDGLWYFHLKARKLGAWGATSNFLIRIDTAEPATFTPATNLTENNGHDELLVSFFTTDELSGIDHYEVAFENKNSNIASPLFTQTESPYQIDLPGPGNYRVFIRAFDHAGNIRLVTDDVVISIPFIEYLKSHDLLFMLILLLIIILLFILHYFFGHKLLRRVHKAFIALELENARERMEEAKETERKILQDEQRLGISNPPSNPPPPEH